MPHIHALNSIFRSTFMGFFSLAVGALLSVHVQAQELIRVGGYEFAPYVSFDNNGQASGLSIDLIEALNALQTEVRFEFVSTSIEQRHQAFKLGRYDAIMFESEEWGWQELQNTFIPLGIKDGEVYISLKSNLKSQTYFDTFTGKKLALVSGYHYQFADWSSDPSTLTKQYDAIFVPSNKAAIESILRGRAELAPVTWSYLQDYINNNPSIEHKLLLSEQWDQEYHHGIILSLNAQNKAPNFATWLKTLKDNGTLSTLAARYHLQVK